MAAIQQDVERYNEEKGRKGEGRKLEERGLGSLFPQRKKRYVDATTKDVSRLVVDRLYK